MLEFLSTVVDIFATGIKGLVDALVTSLG